MQLVANLLVGAPQSHRADALPHHNVFADDDDVARLCSQLHAHEALAVRTVDFRGHDRGVCMQGVEDVQGHFRVVERHCGGAIERGDLGLRLQAVSE